MEGRFLIGKEGLLFGVNELVAREELKGEIAILKKTIEELEKEEKNGLIKGEVLLEELAGLSKACKEKQVKFSILDVGENEADGIQRLCKENYSLLVFDNNSENFAIASGIKYVRMSPKEEKMNFERYFSEDTMSVHMKEGSNIRRKVGKPGDWKLEEMEEVNREEVKKTVAEILKAALTRKDSFIEIERKDSMIAQVGQYRAIIVKPPLSDGWEATITRSVTNKKLEDYNLDPKIIDRLVNKAEGILIAGAPGMGKTTFAQALAEYLARQKKIVKTIESPRDMNLSSEISQYSSRFAQPGEMHDILLLSRPDYTIFDEMRDDEDFKLYVDLRLAGIGMIGIIHASSPVDAIHRFVNRIPIGTITNVVDTVIYMHSGKIQKIYTLSMKVKVPDGMNEPDLARPVISIEDFITGKPEFELYVFGEQIMIVPVKEKFDPIQERLRSLVKDFGGDVEISNGTYVVVISKDEIERFNSKISNKIRKIQKRTGKVIKINVV